MPPAVHIPKVFLRDSKFTLARTNAIFHNANYARYSYSAIRLVSCLYVFGSLVIVLWFEG